MFLPLLTFHPSLNIRAEYWMFLQYTHTKHMRQIEESPTRKAHCYLLQ